MKLLALLFNAAMLCDITSNGLFLKNCSTPTAFTITTSSSLIFPFSHFSSQSRPASTPNILKSSRESKFVGNAVTFCYPALVDVADLNVLQKLCLTLPSLEVNRQEGLVILH